jgi:hypothetical protein
MNNKRLNIAYGSNLNLNQMARRCPTAKVYGKAILKNYRLLFKGTYASAYATIEAYPGGKVPVLIWKLQPRDEKALDIYEGYPVFYDKKDIQLKLENGETVTAMVYIMTEKRIRLSLPAQSYLKTIQKGYHSAGFDQKIIEEALEVSKKALQNKALKN